MRLTTASDGAELVCIDATGDAYILNIDQDESHECGSCGSVKRVYALTPLDGHDPDGVFICESCMQKEINDPMSPDVYYAAVTRTD